MPTVREYINDALMANGAYGADEPMSDADAQLGLRWLIRMIGTWANQNLLVYANTTSNVVLTPGTATYSTSLMSAGRPVKLTECYVSLGGVDYWVEIIDQGTYDAIGFKSTSGIPAYVFDDTAFPSSTLAFYPTPDKAYTAKLTGNYPLAALTITLDTVITLPLGYDSAVVSNLAVATAAPFGVVPSDDVRQQAKDSVAWLKRTNRQQSLLTTNLPTSRPYYSIQGWPR